MAGTKLDVGGLASVAARRRDASSDSGGDVSEVVVPMPVTSLDKVWPLLVKMTLALAAAVVVGVNLTVTVAVAPVPTRVYGLPESILKGAGTKAVPVKVALLVLWTVKVRVAELPMVTLPKLTVPVGIMPVSPCTTAPATSARATALATAEHALSLPLASTAVTEML